MNYETKRNVFGQLLNAYQNLIVKDIEIHDENYRENITTPWNIVYDAALPDDLPVIPNYVAEYIDAEKNNNDVIQAGIDAIEYSKGSIELTTWIEKNGDTFARAWLDGYEIDNKS